jgi:catalase (peroxidase I)
MGIIFSKIQSFMTLQAIKSDIAALVKEKGCGPILVRLSWHDAGVYKEGAGGCPNAVMRFTDGGEGTFGAVRAYVAIATLHMQT